jgi:hypothetical protein
VGGIDYTELVRAEQPFPPAPDDAADRHLLKTDPTILTACDLYAARMARRAKLDVAILAALYADELLGSLRHAGDEMTEPIPY